MPGSTAPSHLGTTIDLDAKRGTITMTRSGKRLRAISASAVVSIDAAPFVKRPVDAVGVAQASVSLLHGGTLTHERRGTVQRAVVRVEHNGFASEWSVTSSDGDPCFEISVAIIAGERALTVASVCPLQLAWKDGPLAAEVASSRWWVWAASGWDKPGTRPLSGALHPDDCPTIAYDIAGAFAPSGAALTLGHILPSRWMNRIDADVDGVTVASTLGVHVAARTSARTDSLFVDPQRGIIDGLAGMGSRHRGRRTAREASEHWGWNSWDYFLDKVTESDIESAIASITALPWMRDKLRYIIVDDSWQGLTGDWQPGARFGSIQRVAKTITAAGFAPGIWTAPFMVDRHSETMKANPDRALKLDDGRLYAHCMGCDPPWGDRCYLDPTHPGVWDHIYQLYRRLHSWGFRYFKTDFLTNSIGFAFPGEQAAYRDQIRFHNPSMGLVRAHRACMEAIRAAIGPDSFWLGCGSHYASGAGLMDATRMSGDIRYHWPNLLVCAKSAIFNFHMHGAGFLIDPDFSVFRGRDTSDQAKLDGPAQGTKPYQREIGNTGPTFDLQEARLWAAVIIMCGGQVILSDRIDGLNQAGLAIVKELLAHGGGPSAIPVDLFEPLPRIWRKQRDGGTWLLLANWDDAGTRRLTVPEASDDASTAEFTDLWTGERIRAGMSVELPPHAHRLLRTIGR